MVLSSGVALRGVSYKRLLRGQVCANRVPATADPAGESLLWG